MKVNRDVMGQHIFCLSKLYWNSTEREVESKAAVESFWWVGQVQGMARKDSIKVRGRTCPRIKHTTEQYAGRKGHALSNSCSIRKQKKGGNVRLKELQGGQDRSSMRNQYTLFNVVNLQIDKVDVAQCKEWEKCWNGDDAINNRPFRTS